MVQVPKNEWLWNSRPEWNICIAHFKTQGKVQKKGQKKVKIWRIERSAGMHCVLDMTWQLHACCFCIYRYKSRLVIIWSWIKNMLKRLHSFLKYYWKLIFSQEVGIIIFNVYVLINCPDFRPPHPCALKQPQLISIGHKYRKYLKKKELNREERA